MRLTFTVAAITAISIGLAGCSSDTPAADGASATASAATSATFEGLDAIQWSPPNVSLAAGSVDLTLTCGAAVNHALAIDGIDGDVTTCEPGGTNTVTTDLAAGTYAFYCSIPGHREAGMEGTLTVS